tara:strand:+ start:365 stop:922 length:558 start_codon:yes stop_codon:yes gene_type:complete
MAYLKVGDANHYKKIGSASFSGASTVTLGQPLGHYSVHKLFLTFLMSGGNASHDLRVQISTGGSFITSSYTWVMYGMISGNTNVYGREYEGTSSWTLNRDGLRDDRRARVEMTLYDLIQTGTGMNSAASWSLNTVNHDADTRLVPCTGHGILNDTSAIDDIKFYVSPASGATTISGEWALYGLNW